MSKNLRILLVDDQDELLQMLDMMLRRRGPYTVETANSGFQAMEVAPDFSPHVVVSDIGMPGMDGIELMQNLRKIEGAQLSPFKSIALSGFDCREDERMQNCGYDAHFTKPVDFDVLFQTIEQMAVDIKSRETKSAD